MGRAVHRGRDQRAVHRLRRLRGGLPPRRPRLRRHQRRLPALPPRGRAGAGRLRPRPAGLHQLHPGLSPLSQLGDRDRHLPVRARARARRDARASARTSSWPGPPTRSCTSRGQDGGLVSAILLWCLEHDRIDAALVSFLEGDGSTWKAMPGLARTREEILASAGSRYTYSANTLAYAAAVEERRRAAGPGGDELPVVGAAGHAGPQGRQGRPAPGPVDRAAVLEDLRRRHLRRAVRGQVRAGPGGHGEDEHQGRLPDLDAGRLLPRDPAQGVPRLDPGGLQDLPGLRRRARRHLDRRDRGVQRLDAHPGAHRRWAARSSPA